MPRTEPRVYSRKNPAEAGWRSAAELITYSTALLSQLLRALAIYGQTRTAKYRARAKRLRLERDQARFVVGRGFLRQILATYLNVAPSQLEFIYEPSGRPVLAGRGGQSRLHFNLSHSGDLVVYAIALGREIGVDIESIWQPIDVEGIARRFFSLTEARSLGSLPPRERQAAFFTCWTRKEAYLKATGRGLSRPLDEFTVSPLPTEPAALFEVRTNPDEMDRWVLYDIPIGAGYAGAMAVEDGARQIAHWEWL
jgi:4'-phosphopantetheinyl transferase